MVGAIACAESSAPEVMVSNASAPAPIRTTGGVVSSSHELASEVGAQIMAAGGNAVDAAIATGLALAVVHPTAGNIGGGGFMVIRLADGTATAVDFREKAPLASTPDMFLDEEGEYSSTIHHNSHIAVGVPGTVAGFWEAHQRFGALEWSRLVEPAVRLATEGFVLSESLARSIGGQVRGGMSGYPASVAAFSMGGEPYAAGAVFSQPDLAGSLTRIRDQGRDGFYLGETARLLAEEMVRGGGLITEQDLAQYQPVVRQPVTGTYRGYEIISMPPPSSGGVAMIEMLNIMEGYDVAALGHNSTAHLHLLAESMRLAYRDRARHLGDPDFVEVPVARLTSKEYAEELRTTLPLDRAAVSIVEDVDLPYESDETTHYSVIDADGSAVSVTYTLEAGYGSKIVVAGAGFLLNNEMGDFNPREGLTTDGGLIGTAANLVAPEKRMLSSMTPSIVGKDGQIFAVVGSPGGRTIINTVLQVVSNLIDFQMSPGDAVAAKRMHHQWLPDRASIEGDGATEEVLEALRAMGHEVRMGGGQGTSHSIVLDPATGEKVGAPDPRGSDAGAAGVAGGGSSP